MIVVNFSTDKYRIGQDRLQQSLYSKGHLNYAMYGNYKQIGGPTHQKSNYEFKVHAMKKAMKEDPIVFWCDASIWLTGNIEVIKNIIADKGYFMEESGNLVRDWCNKATLEHFGLTKDCSWTMFTSGCFGLDMRNSICQEFFRRWEDAAKKGFFNGDWVGDDPHRHDMTCGGIIANQLGMKYEPGQYYVRYVGPGYPEPNPESIFFCQGLV